MSVILLYWFAPQQQTSTSRDQKKFCFTQNLMLNAASLLLASKTNRKWRKKWKKQTMFEKREYTYFTI